MKKTANKNSRKYNVFLRIMYYLYGTRYRKKYKQEKRDYKIYMTDEKYSSIGDYFNWGVIKRYEENPAFVFNNEGVPLVLISDEYVFNPCTMLQYTLALYGRFVRKEIELEPFLEAADKCVSYMAEDGSFRYGFSYAYYCDPEHPYLPGWTSSMDSGHMLSICARAYFHTHNEKYVVVANKCRDFLSTYIVDNGVKCSLKDLDVSLADYYTFEEYPHNPATYTLNGFEFTLLGLYDWYDVYNDSKSGEMFKEGIESLKIILPLYDLGCFTCYDLSHITIKRLLPHIGVGYHCEHIVFNKIFYDLVGDAFFDEYYHKWKGYIE